MNRETDRLSELHIEDLALEAWRHRWFLAGAGMCLGVLVAMVLLAGGVG